MTYKTIQDTVHGSVKFSGPFLELIDCPELQRLRGIKQLGLTNLVFPGANHTRLEHSIGAYHVAEKMSQQLQLKEHEKNTVKAAALLHDVGHAPFSHTLEFIIESQKDKDHMDVTQELIRGDRKIEERDHQTIPDILEDHGIDPKQVADLIKEKTDRVKITDFNVHEEQGYFGEEKYMYQMIHGPLDVDQLDYLLRDSHYTGASHGIIDMERLIQTVEIYNGNLVVSKGGVAAVEGMLVARGLMYSSVYFHKTARIAELMLAKAVDWIEELPENLFSMTDRQFLDFLERKGDFQREVVDRLKYRHLYKKCLSLSREELSQAKDIDLENIGKLRNIRELERRIASKGNIDEKYVLVDVPYEEVKLSEPRLSKTGIKILDDENLSTLSKYSPLARALQRRPTQPWAMMISCPTEMRDKMGEKARKEIMSS
ncbi:MAG: HD domain-containing protein [Candidatus Thermoplasmatota archaeon]|nr:HD domain-containing protein [Candidatus Thermoplasmatota archaeon]MBS3790423.1 HD domain-containing protein [Candidatus Thermoplasmatota archaeon]